MSINDLFKIYLIVIFALITSHYIHGLVFTLFKANKYEDVLAKKIANEIGRVIKETESHE